MPVTPIFGLVYPDSGGNTRLWEHFQNLAESVETALGTVPLLKYVESVAATSNSANFTSAAEVLVDTITVDVVSGENYAIYYYGNFQSSVAGDIINYKMRENALGGNELGSSDLEIPATARLFKAVLYGEYASGSTGAKTFIIGAIRRNGTGTCYRYGASAAPSYMVVHQIT